MADKWYVRDLLHRSRQAFDNPPLHLAKTTTPSIRTLFASGAEWMREALGAIRGRPLPGSHFSFNGLGFAKYGLAAAGALACVIWALTWETFWPCLFIVPVFYALEAQFVFLFPLTLDGSSTPIRDSWRLTRRAGGTVAVMAIVLPLAAVMLFGGFLGKGFVRSWCLGCLSICYWYEDLQAQGEP